MDPLSLSASIIAVLEFTATLISYINEVKNASPEQAKVAIEASNLYSLLTTLRFRVNEARGDGEWFNQVRLLGTENGPLDQFKDILETMVKQLSGSRKRDQIKSALLWKFTKKEVEDTLARMERLKSLINCALTNDLLYVGLFLPYNMLLMGESTFSKAIHSDVVAVREHVTEIHKGMAKLQISADRTSSSWIFFADGLS